MHNIIYDFFGFNKTIFIFINKLTNFGIIASIFKTISQIFFIGNFIGYYFIICLYCYFKLKKNPNPKTKFTEIYNNLVKAGICYALFGLTYAALKFSVNLPRPFCSLPPEEFITIINIKGQRCLSSFPSAHTGLSIIIAYYLWPHLKYYQKIIICALIPITAISRITLAMHYPADILYSIIIVSTIIFLSNKLTDSLHSKIIQPIGHFIFKIIFTKRNN